MSEAICERLIAFGYGKQNKVRMYGEEFELISNPFIDENGFAVQAVSTRSDETRIVRIPLSIVRAATQNVQRRGADAARSGDARKTVRAVL